MKKSTKEHLRKVGQFLLPLAKNPTTYPVLLLSLGYHYTLLGASNVWTHPLRELSVAGTLVLAIVVALLMSLAWRGALAYEHHRREKPKLIEYGGYFWRIYGDMQGADYPLCPNHKYFLTPQGDTLYCTKDESESFPDLTQAKLRELIVGAHHKAQSEI